MILLMAITITWKLSGEHTFYARLVCLLGLSLFLLDLLLDLVLEVVFEEASVSVDILNAHILYILLNLFLLGQRLLFLFRLDHLKLKLPALFNRQVLGASVKIADLRNILGVPLGTWGNSTSTNWIRLVELVNLGSLDFESAGLFKTLILILALHVTPRDKNIRWTVLSLRRFIPSYGHPLLLNLTVLHLRAAILGFHHANHLFFTRVIN